MARKAKAPAPQRKGAAVSILAVVKMRDRPHSKGIREHEITDLGVVVTGGRLNQYRALITGIPAHWKQPMAGKET